MNLLRLLIGPDDAPSLPQFAARAVIIFVFGLACIRLAGRRTFSQTTPLDIVVAILIGSNLSRAMTGKASFIGGLVATVVLVLLHRGVAMASLRWKPVARWVKCEPVVLVRDGRPDPKQLADHEISEQDLMEGLRIEKVDLLSKVKLATLEAGGKISVIENDH